MQHSTFPDTRILATGYSQFATTAIIEDVKTHSERNVCYWRFPGNSYHFFDGRKRCLRSSYSFQTFSSTCRYSAEGNYYVSNLILKNPLERGTATIAVKCNFEVIYRNTVRMTVKGKIIFS